MTPVRILLVDDHELMRAGIRSLLERVGDFAVVGEAGDGHEAIALAQQLRPHIVLMDISMPGLNGIDATARLAADVPEARVVILSMHTAGEYVRRALRAGAAGYLLKHAATAELEIAVRAVARGETYLTPSVSGEIVAGYLFPETMPASEVERLTSRQREILQLVAEGKTTKEIARRLRIGVRTVESHRAAIMKRLNIHDLPGLVRYAIKVGLILPN